MSGSSGRQRVPNDIFDHILICVPPQDTIEKFDRIVAPMFEIVSLNAKENNILASIRGMLLPKLLSGEIRVKVDVEKEFPEETKKLEEIKEEKAKVQKSILEWAEHA
jgi:type I restriction enzyme S subunit